MLAASLHRLLGELEGGKGPARMLHCSLDVLDAISQQAPPPWQLQYWMESVMGVTAVVHPRAEAGYWELRTSDDRTLSRAFDGTGWESRMAARGVAP